jgi:hypothetical protein
MKAGGLVYSVLVVRYKAPYKDALSRGLKEDIAQEAEFIALTLPANENERIKYINNCWYRFFRDYGYTKRRGKWQRKEEDIPLVFNSVSPEP